MEPVETITQRLNNTGYVVCKAIGSDPDSLVQFAQKFGVIQMHARADSAGIVGERSRDGEWKSYRHEYRGIGSEAFLPHTDGSYLQGIAEISGRYVSIGPPKLILIQCVSNSATGGENILLDGTRILKELLNGPEEFILPLLRLGCVSYSRDDQLAFNCSVFKAISGQRLLFRLRLDQVTHAPKWALVALDNLRKRYIENADQWNIQRLAPGDILVIDNYRSLHGRTAVSGPQYSGHRRQVRRTWIYEEATPELTNLGNKVTRNRATQRMQHYAPLEVSGLTQTATPINCGIKLPPLTFEKIKSLLVKVATYDF